LCSFKLGQPNVVAFLPEEVPNWDKENRKNKQALQFKSVIAEGGYDFIYQTTVGLVEEDTEDEKKQTQSRISNGPNKQRIPRISNVFSGRDGCIQEGQ
jgi:hypothetical protein